MDAEQEPCVGEEAMDDSPSGEENSSDEEELQLEKQVTELETSLKSNPYHYDSHVQLIGLLRQLGDLDRARQARQNMSDNFPLSEDLWLQWVQDELPLSTLPEAALQLRLLFETAVEDYLSIPIWLEFAKFTIDRMSLMPEGIDYPRDVFERAIIACGLHVGGANQLWDAYIQFESAILKSLQAMQQENLADTSLAAQVENQFEKVDKLYKRQLGVPHIGMESCFHDYQTFVEGGVVSEDSLPMYMMAKKKLEQYLPFEQELQSSTPPSLDSYRNYLAHLKKIKSDPSLILTLYKRAIAHHPLDTQLWKDFLNFLDTNFSRVGSVVAPGYKQAVRNCPWVTDFWTGYGRALERTNASHEEILAVFEKGLEGNLSKADDYLQLWMSYCDYLRRRGPSHSPPTSVSGVEGVESADGNLVELRKTFKRARDNLEAYYGKDGDPTDSLSRYQASLEARCYSNIEESRRLWGDVMSRHGREAKYWMEYAETERAHDDVDSCRKVLQRATHSASDDPELVCQALLQFERESGSLESYEAALVRCESQLSRVKERREKAMEKEAQKKEDFKKQRKFDQKKGKPDIKGKGQEVGGQGSNRKRGASSSEDGQPSTKRPKFGDHPHEPKGPSLDPRPPSRDLTRVEGVTEVKTEGPKESRTVFVSNLSFDVTEELVRERFSPCGTIAEVRLIKTRQSQKNNVFAYVEFANPDPVVNALKLDKTELCGRTMFVSPFKERSRTETPVHKYSGTKSSTVYVSNLQHNCQEQELEELFKQCGDIKQVRLVKNRGGRPKGFAYVEFVNEASAKAAVMKLHNHELGFKRINVAISNPPKGSKVTEEQQWKGAEFARPSFVPRGAQRREHTDNPFVPMRKTNISLVPRVVAKKSSGATETKEKQTSKLSNEDFRKLIDRK